MTQVEGRIPAVEKITIHAKIGPDRPFPVTVTSFEPASKMVWSNALPLGLFKGVRTSTLTPKGDGVTELTIREVFSGPLTPIFARMIPELAPDLETIGVCLKKTAEAAVPAALVLRK